MKRVLCILLAMVLLCTGIVGCGKNEPTPEAAATATPAPTTDPAVAKKNKAWENLYSFVQKNGEAVSGTTLENYDSTVEYKYDLDKYNSSRYDYITLRMEGENYLILEMTHSDDDLISASSYDRHSNCLSVTIRLWITKDSVFSFFDIYNLLDKAVEGKTTELPSKSFVKGIKYPYKDVTYDSNVWIGLQLKIQPKVLDTLIHTCIESGLDSFETFLSHEPIMSLRELGLSAY